LNLEKHVVDNVMAIQQGRLSLSRITYHTDLQRASGLIIPLGVVAEMAIGQWRALGLIARTKLNPDEAGAVGRLMRDSLSEPFKFLKSEFDWAFSSTAKGEALAALSCKFSQSLFFAPPSLTEMKKVLPTGPTAAEQILSDLRKFRDEEFYLMVAELENEPGPVPSEDSTRLAA
jgi:hypothetical protein